MAHDVNEIVTKYIALRDKKSALKKEFDDKVAKLDTAMETMEVYLAQLMTSLGVDSISADAGTAYTSVRTKVKILDREKARLFVLKTKNLDLLELRASSTGVTQYMQEFGKLPDGFDALVESTVNIRRSN